MYRIVLCCAVLFAGVLAATAHDYRLGGLSIGHPWARPTPGDSTLGAVYMTVDNTGIEDDSLRGAVSPVAQKVEIHEHKQDDQGVMRMRRVETGINIPSGDSIQLKPGGYHIMLIGLKQKLEEGQSVPLTLSFARAGDIEVEVKIENGPAHASQDMGEAHSQHHHHKH